MTNNTLTCPAAVSYTHLDVYKRQDRNFIEPSQIRKLCGKRRFTLAHECAHQILFQMETDKIREACRRKYSARTAYSLRALKTREDWNEWQANVLDVYKRQVMSFSRRKSLIVSMATFNAWSFG